LNYLAHIYLSQNINSIEIGNFIADSVKGNTYLNYPKDIQKGIILHRRIDWFTDNDAIVKQSKKRLHQRYGHYKGIIIDIFYDHFLAKNWAAYSDVPLDKFTQEFYSLLNRNIELLPAGVQKITPYMIDNDWLTSYASLSGIERVLKGMNRRTDEKSQMHLSINDLKENYKEFEDDFILFFKKLCTFSAHKLQEINNDLD